MKLPNWPPPSKTKEGDKEPEAGKPKANASGSIEEMRAEVARQVSAGFSSAERPSLEGTGGGDLDSVPPTSEQNRRFQAIPEEPSDIPRPRRSTFDGIRLEPENTSNTSIEDQTPAERKNTLSKNVTETQAALAERAGVSSERTGASAALEARYEPLKQFLRAEAAFNRIKKPTEEDVEEFESERAIYETSRKANLGSQLAYVSKLQESAKDRAMRKGMSSIEFLHIEKTFYKIKNPTEKQIAEFELKRATYERTKNLLTRYNRIVRVREIVIPGKEQENRIREELLDEKGRNIFQKLVKFNKNMNDMLQNTATSLITSTPWGKKMSVTQVERFSRAASRATRLIGFAGVAAGAGLTGSVLFGGAAATAILAGAGARVGFGLASTGAGALAGAKWGDWFVVTKGKARAEVFNEAQEKDISSEADLEEQISAHTTGSVESIEKDRVKRENIAAALIGLTTAGSLAIEHGALSSIQHAGQFLSKLFSGEKPEIPAGVPTSIPTPKATSGALDKSFSSEATPEGRIIPPDIKAPAAESIPGGSTTNGTTPAMGEPKINMVENASIHKSGEGSDQLFHDLKAKIKASTFFSGTHSPALKHLLETRSNDLSREMGAAFGKRGMTMHSGDSFMVDKHENVYFQPAEGKEQLFIENKPDGSGFTVHHDLQGSPLASAGHTPAHQPEVLKTAEPKLTTTPNHEASATVQTSSTPGTLPPPDVKSELSEAPKVYTASAQSPETLPAPTSTVGVPQQPVSVPVATPTGTMESLTASIPNRLGVPIYTNEVHLYGAPDPDAPGKDSLILYVKNLAANKKSLFETLNKLAPSNLGKTIYFQSPEPLMVDGVETPWIATAQISETGQVSLSPLPDPTHPEFVGATLNPDIFTKLIK